MTARAAATITRRAFLASGAAAAGALVAGCAGGSTVSRRAGTARTGSLVRVRGFDLEEDGPIDLTTQGPGSTIEVGSRHARAGGKGVAVRAADVAHPIAFVNLHQQPVAECWLRVSLSPRGASVPDAIVHVARIASTQDDVSEHLRWVTGRGLELSSVRDRSVPIPEGRWTQVQLGIRSTGQIELWVHDGRRARLAVEGRRPALSGTVKDVVAFGNDSPLAPGYEVWLDDLAVGTGRLPWADEPRGPHRPRPLDPARLGRRWSFVFGSCNNAKQVPYSNTALGAATGLDPDFYVHLGDFGYADTNAYRQTSAGYLAMWSDLLEEPSVAAWARKPWIMLASDHDLGGNDIDTTSVNLAALDAFDRFQSNDEAADGVGRYGSVVLDAGRVLLVWTEGIAFRSPRTAPDGPAKTVLGPEQKAWLLGLLARTRARLVILALQTPLGLASTSDWVPYGTERAQVLAACESSPALVRVISGDYHHAAVVRLGSRTTEWTAAPLAEFCEPTPAPAPDAVGLQVPDTGPGFASRPQALAQSTPGQLDAATSFGRVAVDADAGQAVFELRDARGRLRRDRAGVALREVIRYA